MKVILQLLPLGANGFTKTVSFQGNENLMVPTTARLVKNNKELFLP